MSTQHTWWWVPSSGKHCAVSGLCRSSVPHVFCATAGRSSALPAASVNATNASARARRAWRSRWRRKVDIRGRRRGAAQRGRRRAEVCARPRSVRRRRHIPAAPSPRRAVAWAGEERTGSQAPKRFHEPKNTPAPGRSRGDGLGGISARSRGHLYHDRREGRRYLQPQPTARLARSGVAVPTCCVSSRARARSFRWHCVSRI
jgi:hypothetical protein